MNRIPGMHEQLVNWSRWVNGGGGVGTGYPRASCYCRGYVDRHHSPMDAAVPTDAVDAQRVDDAIKQLQLTKSHLHVVIIQHYQRGKEIKQVAALMLKSPATVKTYLAQADHELQAWLRDRSRQLRKLA